MTQITDKFLAGEVPEGAENVRVSQIIGTPKLFADIPGALWAVKLPPGTYRFLFTTKTATEEDARKVVEKEELFINGISQGVLYCNYHIPHDVCEWYKQATNSLASLLRSKNLDPNKNYALIVKN